MTFKNIFKNREVIIPVSFLGNLLLVFFLFTLCRIFFYLFNTDLFPGISFVEFTRILLGGARFDVSAIFMLNAPYILFTILLVFIYPFKRHAGLQKFLKYWFITTNALALMSNCIDMGYFPFTLRRTNASFFSEFKGDVSLFHLIFDMLADYWYVVLLWLCFIFIMAIFYLKMRPFKKPRDLKSAGIYYFISTVSVILFLFTWVIGVRGDFRNNSRPITLSNAGDYVQRPLEVAIVQNTPFCIIKTIGKKIPEKISYFSSIQELEEVYNPYQLPTGQEPFVSKNVVIIIWESLSREFVGGLNKALDQGNYAGYTPFIDSLLHHSITFEYSYANGRKSIDALPSIITSIPFLNDPYILSPFSGNFTEGLGVLLKKKGYHTSFFHGAHRGSMGFWAFMKMNGFDYSYAEEDYIAAHPATKGGWGIWDEDFLQYMATELSRVSEPFCSVVFTLSSHHPFILPEKYDGVFKEGPHPLQRCIGYTDYSLQRFFETASKQPWFENTLFVITADHANSPTFPQNNNSVGQMSVPVIIYEPGNPVSAILPNVVQQTDIMPTILGMLHYDEPFVAFGQNALDTSIQHIAVNSLANKYHVYFQEYVLICHEDLSIIGLFDLKTDPFLKRDIHAEHPELTRRLTRHLQGFIQQYNSRMIDNCLTKNCPHPSL